MLLFHCFYSEQTVQSETVWILAANRDLSQLFVLNINSKKMYAFKFSLINIFIFCIGAVVMKTENIAPFKYMFNATWRILINLKAMFNISRYMLYICVYLTLLNYVL